jgi:hypothetical protein
MALATQFCFDAAPVIAWVDRLQAEGIALPVHIGIAGPAKLQTLIKFAIACGVGPSLKVLQKRAMDVSKLLLPYEPDSILRRWPPTRPPTPPSASRPCISSRWAVSRPPPTGPNATASARSAPPPDSNRRTPMTRTIVESATKTVVIGFDEPFCVIGERINPTGRKKLAAELEAGDFSTVEKDALEQVACGAMVLDVNAGVVYNSNPNPNETEPPLMRKVIELVQGLVDVPLCIDSSVPAALEAGLAATNGRPLLNSVTGEEDRLELVLPLVKKYNVPVVAISNDDTGISEDPDVRFAVAKKIVERAADFGIPAHDIVVDPLVMPVGAMASAGQQVFALVRRLRDGTGRQHHLRRLEHQLRPAQPARRQRRLPAHGDRRRHDLGDHEPRPLGRDGGDPRREPPDEPRRQRRRMDPHGQGPGSGQGRRQLRRGQPGREPGQFRSSRRPTRARLTGFCPAADRRLTGGLHDSLFFPWRLLGGVGGIRSRCGRPTWRGSRGSFGAGGCVR